VIFLFVVACIKKKEYDTVPAIKFVDFPVFSHIENSKNKVDSAHVILSFTDGDGDIGNTNDAVMSLFLDYYEDEGSGFVFKNVTYKIHLPILAPEGNNMAIEGTIQQLLRHLSTMNFLFSRTSLKCIWLIGRVIKVMWWRQAVYQSDIHFALRNFLI